jgi:hypothetical protein
MMETSRVVRAHHRDSKGPGRDVVWYSYRVPEPDTRRNPGGSRGPHVRTRSRERAPRPIRRR